MHMKRDSQGQETFSEPTADNQSCNYDTECSNHHPSLPTLRSKELSQIKMKWFAIYTNLQKKIRQNKAVAKYS